MNENHLGMPAYKNDMLEDLNEYTRNKKTSRLQAPDSFDELIFKMFNERETRLSERQAALFSESLSRTVESSKDDSDGSQSTPDKKNNANWTCKYDLFHETDSALKAYHWSKTPIIARVCSATIISKDEESPTRDNHESHKDDVAKIREKLRADLMDHLASAFDNVEIHSPERNRRNTSTESEACTSDLINYRFTAILNKRTSIEVKVGHRINSRHDSENILDIVKEEVDSLKADNKKRFFWIIFESLGETQHLDLNYAFNCIFFSNEAGINNAIKKNELFDNAVFEKQATMFLRLYEGRIDRKECANFFLTGEDTLLGGSAFVCWIISLYQLELCTIIAAKSSTVAKDYKKHQSSSKLISEMDDFKKSVLIAEVLWMHDVYSRSISIDQLTNQYRSMLNIGSLWSSVKEETISLFEYAEKKQRAFTSHVQTIGGMFVGSLLLLFAFAGSNFFDKDDFYPFRQFVFYDNTSVFTSWFVLLLGIVAASVLSIMWYIRRNELLPPVEKLSFKQFLTLPIGKRTIWLVVGMLLFISFFLKGFFVLQW